MDFNPAKHVKMDVKEAPERPVWTVEQYKRFHNEISPNTPNISHSMFSFGVDSGSVNCRH